MAPFFYHYIIPFIDQTALMQEYEVCNGRKFLMIT